MRQSKESLRPYTLAGLVDRFQRDAAAIGKIQSLENALQARRLNNTISVIEQSAAVCGGFNQVYNVADLAYIDALAQSIAFSLNENVTVVPTLAVNPLVLFLRTCTPVQNR